MTEFLIVAGIYLAGWVITFRLDAWYAITRQNERRDDAIRQATRTATIWPIAGLALVAIGIHEVLTAGLPQSRADRDAEIAELEREVLGDRFSSLREAREGSSWKDTAALDLLRATGAVVSPDTRMPSGKTVREVEARRGLVCVNCGVPLVPSGVGFVHVPEGWYAPCDYAVPTRRPVRATTADDPARDARRLRRRRVMDRHIQMGHSAPLVRCPECWPQLP